MGSPTKVKGKRKRYMTDSRRREIIETAISGRKSPGDKFKELLPESYNKLTQMGYQLEPKQGLRHLYSSYENDGKVNFVVVLLKSGITSSEYWAIWEINLAEPATPPVWRGFLRNTPSMWWGRRGS